MGDTLITVVAIGLAAILMFVFPLMSVSERNDDVGTGLCRNPGQDFPGLFFSRFSLINQSAQ